MTNQRNGSDVVSATKFVAETLCTPLTFIWFTRDKPSSLSFLQFPNLYSTWQKVSSKR